MNRAAAATSRRWLLTLLLVIASAFSVYPMLLMLFNSFKTGGELSLNPGGLPTAPTLANFADLLSYNGGLISRTFLNGVFVATSFTVLAVFISACAAFAFAKFHFPGRDLLFVLLLATLMVPYQLQIPALFLFFAKIGWLNTLIVQIVPGTASVFTMFFIRQYMQSIPDALIEAARIDGASYFRIFWSIILPVSRPVLGATAILMFLQKWNDYLWPIIMVSDPLKLPITVILPTLNSTSSQFIIPWPMVLAGCVVVTIPLVVVFLIFQNSFMSSATLGSVKE